MKKFQKAIKKLRDKKVSTLFIAAGLGLLMGWLALVVFSGKVSPQKDPCTLLIIVFSIALVYIGITKLKEKD